MGVIVTLLPCFVHVSDRMKRDHEDVHTAFSAIEEVRNELVEEQKRLKATNTFLIRRGLELSGSSSPSKLDWGIKQLVAENAMVRKSEMFVHDAGTPSCVAR